VLAEGVGVHQTALYDMLLAAVLFAFLWWFIRSPRREGMVTLTFGLWYGSMRLLEDSLRIDKRFGPLTGSQWTALTVATICVALLVWFASRRPEGPTTPPRRPLRATPPAPGREPPGERAPENGATAGGADGSPAGSSSEPEPQRRG
jgi:hypothetical protein